MIPRMYPTSRIVDGQLAPTGRNNTSGALREFVCRPVNVPSS